MGKTRNWKAREKLAGRENGKKEGISSRFIFVIALSQFSISEPGRGYLLSATVHFSPDGLHLFPNRFSHG